MERMQVLKDNLSVIEKVVPRGSEIIYLDYPLHLNVGDLLILKGAEQFFKENDYKVITRHSDHTSMNFVEKTDSIPEHVVIVLHGGGNFGDLYPAHQRLREAVVKKYRNNQVVILPQTVHFKDKANLLKSGAIFKQHPNLTIFCRDTNSEAILKEHFCDNVFLCPDMAQSLWNVFPQQKSGDIKQKAMWMIRRDIEKTDLSALGAEADPNNFVDWHDICTDADRRFMKFMHLFEKLNRKIPGNLFPTNTMWYQYTDKLVDRVNQRFMSHDSVITSRMHGHILCCLLKMNTQLIDNSYGKNSGYYESWTKGVPGCELVKL
ncbi:polysaccharide pyruvyl transferase family protein [Serratia rhizosphaerae]|uniref:Exopolysaccharide biosynthesis protein n=1 Tax=Serratia rhizosphaerae TaxID=2597702 RepID=A0ABX6GI50_9GAMM|nr:polysaccharide pyruvyl transferase family protein [Serratia rhizosphaerae]MEB6335159.1 polysaccharide pyruvyl transferase family protein [Serratia rhizosphaerae]QHA85941.1 exopolysaccharide biosynthesis protein [Serratia rhizosphaerae]